MPARGPFDPRTVVLLIVVGLAAFFGALGLDVLGGDAERRRPAGANAFSESAVGYRALVEVLRSFDIPVRISRFDRLSRVDDTGVLVLAEPEAAHLEVFERRLAERPVLVVLPKWDAAADPLRPRWIGPPIQVNRQRQQRILNVLHSEITVARVPAPVAWTPSAFPRPTLSGTVQLASSERGRPVISGPDGSLLMKLGGKNEGVWVLSDPDPMANHGIGDGSNAYLVALILDHLRRGGPVIFDETVHGFTWSPSLWATMVSMPFLPVTLLAVAGLATLAWAASGRFGTPRAAPPPREPGKMTLIDSTADLLLFAGNPGRALARYRDAVLDAVTRAVHAPPAPNRASRIAWLDELAEARGIRGRFGDLSARVDRQADRRTAKDGALVDTARKLHRWKQDMIHGSGTRPIDRR